MIQGVHAMFYSDQADALRAFMRDKLELRCTDIGEGWLIFDLPGADMGVHPTDPEGRHGSAHNTHAISFYTDDLESTMSDLRAKGVEFLSEVQDQGWGLVTQLRAPGELVIQLYQPRYRTSG